MKKFIYIFILHIGFTFTFNSYASEITVATSKIEPMCYDSNNGFSIFLLKKIEKFSNKTFVTKNFPDLQSKLKSVINNESEMATCGISYTYNRAKNMDSIHIMETGASILSLVNDSFITIDDKNKKRLFISIFIIIIAGVLLTIVERLHKKSFFSDKNIINFLFSPKLSGGGIHSIDDGINSIIGGSTTLGSEETPRTRFVNYFIYWPTVLYGMATLLTIVGSIIITSASNNAKYNIKTISDLKSYKVATKEGTIHVDYLKKNKIQPLLYKTTDELYKALLNKKIDLIVYDELPIQHYALKNKKVTTIGPRLNPQDYRWYFKKDSKHKDDIELALLKIKEAGIFENLKIIWFGK